MKKTKIYVVSTTHWDREWYQTFEQYRWRLVRMMDEAIDILETEPSYRCFHLDGQTVVLEDYLEIRPEMAERLARLIKERRLLIGPWYTMPDEFLISGEALIRNLRRGAEISGEYGAEYCKSGYVCDIFGHNSQLPQIFRGFGVDNASLFRGRKGYEKTDFLWRGADGSELITHKLHPDYAYSSFFFVVRWPFEGRDYDFEEMAARTNEYFAAEKKYFATDSHLMLDGVDHIDPERRLPQLLSELNKRLPEYEFVHSDYEDYTAAIRGSKDKLELVSGVLYEPAKEGVNNNVIKNVLSSMVHLKQANDRLESGLTLFAEPLDAFIERTLPPMRTGRKGFFHAAWTEVLRGQAHDSICGCSITPVHEDCVSRYRHAEEIVATTGKEMLRYFASRVERGGKGQDGAFIVYNPSQVETCGCPEVDFEIESGTHQLQFRFYGEDGKDIPYNVTGFSEYFRRDAEFNRLIRFPKTDVMRLAMEMTVPPGSYRVITYDILKQDRDISQQWGFLRYDAPNRNEGTMRTGLYSADNGLIQLSVNANGTLNVRDKVTGRLYGGLLAFEDTADLGDGWNYRKGLLNGEYYSHCSAADISVECDFPAFLRFKIETVMRLPATSDYLRGRSKEKRELTVTSYVTMTKASKRLDIRTVVDNGNLNHRLRAVFPTGFASGSFKTLLPFDMYEWAVEKEDTHDYKEADTRVNPNQGAVTLTEGADMFTVYNKGLYEVEVSPRPDRSVYLTLFRSFPHEVSETGAVMGRMLTEMTFDYAVDFTRLSDNEVVKNANAFKLGLFTAPCSGAEPPLLPAIGTLYGITGGAVLSAFTDDGDGQTVRIYDTGGGCEGAVSVGRPIASAERTDLSGKALAVAPISGNMVKYKLRPKEIQTFKIKFK